MYHYRTATVAICQTLKVLRPLLSPTSQTTGIYVHTIKINSYRQIVPVPEEVTCLLHLGIELLRAAVTL
jgi:hypothetical protein